MILDDLSFDGDDVYESYKKQQNDDVIVYTRDKFEPLVVHPNSKYQFLKEQCMSCRLPTTYYCANCHCAYYCNKHCQKQDWILHRELCKTTRCNLDIPIDRGWDLMMFLTMKIYFVL